MGLVALWHVESSQARDKTCVPCIGRQTLIHYTTREIQILFILLNISAAKFLCMCPLLYSPEESSEIESKGQCIFLLGFFFSIMVYHRISNIVPCAMQQDLVV